MYGAEFGFDKKINITIKHIVSNIRYTRKSCLIIN